MTQKIHVDPAGDDRNTGTLTSPLATLPAALAMRRVRGGGDIQLAPGYHRLRETLVIDPRDHGLRIVGEAKQTTIGSAVPVEGWQRVDDHLWRAALPKGLTHCHALFMGERMLTRARCEPFQPLARWNDFYTHLHDLPFPKGAIPADAAARGGEVRIVPSWPWVMNLLPLSEVDEKLDIAHTRVPGTYALGSLNFGHFPKGSCWLENTVEGLREPGQWCCDPHTRTITLWPLDGEPRNILAPTLTELVRVEGLIDHDGPRDEPVRDVHFDGLTFTHADYRLWTSDKQGLGLQHDWEMYDRATAMLRFRGAEDGSVEQCRFVNSGAAGVRCDLHAQRVRITRNHFHDLGGVGVLLQGYGPGTKDVNHHHVVADNHIHHTGLIEWHAPGIFIWQSGHNHIARNHIHHVAYSGIVVSTRAAWDKTGFHECSRTVRFHEIPPALHDVKPYQQWRDREPYLHARHNTVELNDIHDCMQILGDGNGIYVSGTGDGNLVRFNYIHDIDSPSMNAAVRCDDDQHGVTIHGNLIVNTCGEGFIIKGTNHITNNIVYGLRRTAPDGTVCLHQRGYLIFPWADISGSNIQRNICVTLDPAIPLTSEGGNKAEMRYASTDFNLYHCPTDPTWGQTHLDRKHAQGTEQHSLATDPLFVDAEHRNFHMRADSPARPLGIVELPLEQMVIHRM